MVWDSLAVPREPRARPWLDLLDDEVEPRVLGGSKPDRLVWSSLWVSRPDDEVHFDLETAGSETLLRYTLLTPDGLPDASKTGHLRKRLSEILFRDLRYSYGQ